MMFPEDGVDARLVYPWLAAEGMETLLCWNSDVILCLDPLVIFIYVIAFVINIVMYHFVVACMNKQILAYM